MLAALLALALGVTPAPGPVQPPDEKGFEVTELIITARRHAPDPSQVTTECVLRELPPAERAALESEIGRTAATLANDRPHRPDPSVITEAGVAVALRACGAPAAAESLPFARTAVRFYALERIAADALAARGMGDARLDSAWAALSADDRETLAAQAARVARGSDEEPLAAAQVIFGLLRRLRPVNALNPLAYRRGSGNHLIVAHYAPRAVRVAMEKRF
jgi:hypothetical protein